MTSPGSVPTEELAKADVIDWTKGDAARWKVDIVIYYGSGRGCAGTRTGDRLGGADDDECERSEHEEEEVPRKVRGR